MLGPLCWLPFVLLILVFVLGFLGLAYSIYPYVVLDQLTIWQAASSPAALKVILVGRLHLGAGHRRLHGVLVPRVPRQDGGAEVRVSSRPGLRRMTIHSHISPVLTGARRQRWTFARTLAIGLWLSACW